jgi:hypothetical protein
MIVCPEIITLSTARQARGLGEEAVDGMARHA